MVALNHTNVLSGLVVSDAMRRMAIQLPRSASIEQAIRCTIKFKVNAILITGNSHEAVGVVSKTDLMSAYYADMPIATILEHIMVGPPLFCHPGDSLDSALDTMRNNRIHRLYVQGEDLNHTIGVLAYPDIVGLLYRYCHRCERSVSKERRLKSQENGAEPLTVQEVMTRSVQAYTEHDTLLHIMEGLATQRFGAVLIRRNGGVPVGIISKTDLIVAYKHGVRANAEAGTIMNAPARSCDQEEPLVSAIRTMIFSDIHRLFVHKESTENIVGVLSLTDAARVRSGCCRACVTARIRVEGGF